MSSPPDLNEHRLNTMVPVPVGEYRELVGVDLAVDLTDKGEVYARDELNCGGLVGVVLAASDLEAVDAVLMNGLSVGAHT